MERMYSFVLKSKLRQLNDKLFIDDSRRNHVQDEHYASALCLRRGKRSDELTAGQYAQLDTDGRKFLESYDKGELNEFVCGIPHGWIPEHDEFHFDFKTDPITKVKSIHKYKVLARGWRSILLLLAKRKLISLEKARRVFGCSSLGLSQYDNTDFDHKVLWASGLKVSHSL